MSTKEEVRIVFNEKQGNSFPINWEVASRHVLKCLVCMTEFILWTALWESERGPGIHFVEKTRMYG